MWEAIKTHNLGADHVKEIRLQTLITEFENLKMSDNDTIDAYAAKLSGIASKSATLGKVISELKLVKKFLTSLPRRFVHIVEALEQVLDLKTMAFEDVVGRLKAYEERVKQEDKANNSQEKLLYARTDHSNKNSDSSRGRGRGSYSRGHGRGRGQGRGGATLKTKFRHFVSKCPDQKQDYKANLSETHEGDVNHEEGTFFMMNHIQETIFMNEEKYTPPKNESNTDEDDVWYFNNGASNHMTVNLMHNLAKGVPVIKHQDQVCESCMVRKQTKKSFLKKATYRASKILEMVHGDICGPITPSTQAGNSYILVLIDDCSSDEEGLAQMLTDPYAPQQNGIVERRNRTLLEMTRCMMKARGVPNYF
ncbi:retrovirus-related pol polyprotein from transposon TNT 1-94 [Tanacetum coccineum]